MKQKHKTLTRREIEVLLLISKGHSTKEIADILSVHFETVKTHRKNIIYKFESKNIIEALSKAIIINELELKM